MINNKRDLGGMITKDGRAIRPGMLVRSAQLSEAVGDDLEGVSEVIDLRTPKERLEAPDQTWYASYSPMPIFETIMPGISHEDELTGRSIPDMTKLYEKLMKECADTFRNVLLEIMDHDYDSGAVLWHCTEGKDRCGMTSALILEMLGVSRESIMEDYLKTNLVNLPKAREIRKKAAAVYGPEFAEGVYQAYIADKSYLEAAWEAMGENYIGETLKIDEEKITKFREKILTDYKDKNSEIPDIVLKEQRNDEDGADNSEESNSIYKAGSSEETDSLNQKKYIKENEEKTVRQKIILEKLEHRFSVCKVKDYSGINLDQEFCFTGRTDEEKSLVCPEELVADNMIIRDDGWRGFRICGQLDFSLIGILAAISQVLADNQIGIFAISTYNTDYILTKEENIDRAIRALEDAGYEISPSGFGTNLHRD